MAFRYYRAQRLSDLFPVLQRELAAERARLRPQTPQTIVVGNLDTEAWLTRQFLAVNRILMGVQFPFLESAIENLLLRLTHEQIPQASESWFSAPAGLSAAFAGRAELEIVLLSLIHDSNQAALFLRLGYKTGDLTALQKISLARSLTRRLREHLLHIPRQMQHIGSARQKSSPHPLAAIWSKVCGTLRERNLTSPLIDTEQATSRIIAERAKGLKAGSLYLFGMPPLSAWHLHMLTAIASIAEVRLFSYAPDDKTRSLSNYSQPIRQKFAAYAGLLREEATEFSVEFTEHIVEAEPQRTEETTALEVWAVPGKWRAAELILDHYHARMLAESGLCQYDFGISASDLETQLAAFELAAEKRALTVGTREKVYERANDLAQLLGILFAAASRGLDRTLIIEYFENAALRAAFNLDAELVTLFVGILEKAHGYRTDYGEDQAAFNFAEALQRIYRGVLIAAPGENPHDVPGYAIVPELDSAEKAARFAQCVGFLLQFSRAATHAKGSDLLQLVRNELSDGVLAEHAAAPGTNLFLDRISSAGIPPELSAAELASVLAEHLPTSPLATSSGTEGIMLSPLYATGFTRSYHALFDLGENLDEHNPPSSEDMPEYHRAVTRLERQDQLRLALLAALHSRPHELLFVYAERDTATGADKYPARELEALREALAADGTTFRLRSDFSETALTQEGADDPALSAGADQWSSYLVANPPATALPPLAQFLLPQTAAGAVVAQVALRDLVRYLANPALYYLRQTGVLPGEGVDFRREEPILSVASGARLRFAENYLQAELFDAAGAEGGDVLKTVLQNQRNGNAAQRGFDHVLALIDTNDNGTRLCQNAAAYKASHNIVEYVFAKNVAKPFSVQETERLERWYLPAVRIGAVSIAGKSARFLRRDGQMTLILPDSGLKTYSRRTQLLIEAHLTMVMLIVSGNADFRPDAIEIGKFQVSDKNAKQYLLQHEYAATGSIPAPLVKDAAQYLAALVSALQKPADFWFDLALIPNKLDSYAAVSVDDLPGKLADQEGKNQNERDEFMRRFYQLEVSEKSADFFDRFIRPVALIDQALNRKEKAEPKTGTKRGKK